MTSDKVGDKMAEVVGQIVATIETGGAGGWEKCWRQLATRDGYAQMNARTANHYTGGNRCWLAFSEMLGASPPWATFNQWKELGAMVLKGSKGTPIFVPMTLTRPEQPDSSTTDDDPATFMVWKVAYVFHAGQVEGWVPPPTDDDNIAGDEWDDLSVAYEWTDRVIARHHITVTEGNPSYVPTHDIVRIPARHAFTEPVGYYSTLWHEFTHWTGHNTRLNRLEKFKRWGDDSYAGEELVAELGSAFLCADLGIEPDGPRADHAAYLASWLGALKAEPKRLWQAARAAETAVAYLNGGGIVNPPPPPTAAEWARVKQEPQLDTEL